MAGTGLAGTVGDVDRRDLLRRSAGAGLGFGGAMILSAKVGATAGSPLGAAPPLIQSGQCTVKFNSFGGTPRNGISGTASTQMSFKCVPTSTHTHGCPQDTGAAAVEGIGRIQFRVTLVEGDIGELQVEVGGQSAGPGTWVTVNSQFEQTPAVHLSGPAVNTEYRVRLEVRAVCCYTDGPGWSCSSSEVSITTKGIDDWVGQQHVSTAGWAPCSDAGLPC